MATTSMWTYAETVRTGGDLSGYDVESVDGGIGKIDEATYEAGASCIVVDTGPWIFGKKVMIPAGVIEHVDHEEQKVFLNRMKEQIKNAPEFDETKFDDDGYRNALTSYYARPDAEGLGDF